MTGPAFHRHIGIDYSGAQTPTSSLTGLRVYVADRNALPREVGPPPSPRKYWTRREVGEWLSARLSEDVLTLVGIDHGFSFPLQYFQTHGLLLNWPAFLEDFLRHWPTADDHVYVDFVRHGLCGNAAARSGDLCNGNKHFHFDRALRSGAPPRLKGIHTRVDTSTGALSKTTRYTLQTKRGDEDAFELATECIESWRKFIRESTPESLLEIAQRNPNFGRTSRRSRP